jgi:uncharacterized protein (DUF302 family)
VEAQTRSQVTETVVSAKGFDEAVEAVLAEVAKAKFRVLHVHDVQATLQEKGFAREPYKIIEVCNAAFASKALDAHPLVGVMMPCKINVYVADGQTHLSLLLPGLLASFFPGLGLEPLAQDVETILRGVLAAAR